MPAVTRTLADFLATTLSLVAGFDRLIDQHNPAKITFNRVCLPVVRINFGNEFLCRHGVSSSGFAVDQDAIDVQEDELDLLHWQAGSRIWRFTLLYLGQDHFPGPFPRRLHSDDPKQRIL